MPPVVVGGMNSDLRWRQGEDEPTSASVDIRQAQDVAQEGAVSVWVGAV